MPDDLPPVPRLWRDSAAVIAIAAVLALGLQLRLDDPSSTSVIPAEDPYTHMALVREHLRDGELDPLYEPSALYPPGLHAAVAATLGFTGLQIDGLVRYMPTAFGVLSVLGMAVLLWRLHSRTAAVAGALAMAVMPETVFRTTMLAPTALDLAVLPFLFLALIETLKGRLGFAWMAGALSALLVMAHPWVFAVVAPTGIALLVFAIIMPWPGRSAPRISAAGFVLVLAIVGVSTAFSLSGCWGACGPGFANIVPDGHGDFALVAPLLAILSVLPLAYLKADRRPLRWLLRTTGNGPLPLWAQLTAAATLATAFIIVTLSAVQKGLPDQVDLLHMMGWPVLALAVLGLAAAPFMPSPATHLGLAVTSATLPFVLHNPLDSPFWPHRTAAYLAVGLAILCGIVVAEGVRLAQALAQARPAGQSPAKPGARRRTGAADANAWYTPPEPTAPAATGPTGKPAPGAWRRAASWAAPGLLVMVAVAGTVVAATPESYSWYRLYSDCQDDALQDIADWMDEHPEAVVVSAAWQPKLVLAALATDASRSWYTTSFFFDDAEREQKVATQHKAGRDVLVVVDPYGRESLPSQHFTFTQDGNWTLVGTWCQPATLGATEPGRAAPPNPSISAYVAEASP